MKLAPAAVPTRKAAAEAAEIYKATQPQLDAVKALARQNEAAKKILGAWMVDQDLDLFRGITLKLVEAEGWDEPALLVYLGDKVAQFRRTSWRKYFGIVPAKAGSLKVAG